MLVSDFYIVCMHRVLILRSMYVFKMEFFYCSPEDSVEQISSVDAEQMFLGVNNVLSAICPRLKDFHAILLDPPKVR